MDWKTKRRHIAYIKMKTENDELVSGTAKGFLCLFIIGLCVFATLFLQKSMENDIPVIKPTTTIISGKEKGDSIILCSNEQRLEYVEGEMERIRDQYQMDISIGIDKLNSWIGFWLAILTFVLMLAGIWQYTQVRRHDAAWEQHKAEFDKIKQEIESEREKLKNETLKEKTKLETTIFNLLRTLAALHDPMMLMSTDERKRNIYDYLHATQDLIMRYHQIESKENFYNQDECLVFRLIFTNLRINLCRSFTLFSSPSASLKMQNFIRFLKQQEEAAHYSNSLQRGVIDDFLKRFGELMQVLR